MLTDNTDIVIEALEVLMVQVLYVRQVYPARIFKKRRIYNSNVYASIYPPLNDYLRNVLRSAMELHKSGELEKVEIILYQNEADLVERYDLQVARRPAQVTGIDDDHHLFEFEQQLRSALRKLVMRLKPLDPLPRDTKFRVLVQTTQSAFVRMSSNPHYQDFPWLYEPTQDAAIHKPRVALLPLRGVEHIGLRFDAYIANCPL